MCTDQAMFTRENSPNLFKQICEWTDLFTGGIVIVDTFVLAKSNCLKLSCLDAIQDVI